MVILLVSMTGRAMTPPRSGFVQQGFSSRTNYKENTMARPRPHFARAWMHFSEVNISVKDVGKKLGVMSK